MIRLLKLQAYLTIPFIFAIGIYVFIPNSINFESSSSTIILLLAFLLAISSVYAGKIYGKFLESYANQNNVEEHLAAIVKNIGIIVRVVAIPSMMLSYFWYRFDASSSLLWVVFKWIILFHAVLSFMRGIESYLGLSSDSRVFQGKYFLEKGQGQKISNINKTFERGMIFLLIFSFVVLIVMFRVNRNYTEHVYKFGSLALFFMLVIIGIRMFKNYR